ncbi:MAG: hypothetical protein ACFCUX_05650 [Candidatus Methylacidiphilales bacterium]
MPLGKIEGEILRLLSRNRNPDSHVGGATVLNQSPQSPRSSKDIDLFHDTRDAINRAFEDDVHLLRSSGYEVKVLMDRETLKRAGVSKEGGQTKLEWLQDSSFRFFPVQQDVEMGYRLHYWDAATNKVLAAASRNVIRDYIDLVYIHQQRLSLGALVWAAAGKDDGLSPLFIIEEMVRLQRYPAVAYEEVTFTQPFDRKEAKIVWLDAIRQARVLCGEILLDAPYGCLFLNDEGEPVTPTAETWRILKPHYGKIRGAWPRIAED